jgi:hypothetical protein
MSIPLTPIHPLDPTAIVSLHGGGHSIYEIAELLTTPLEAVRHVLECEGLVRPLVPAERRCGARADVRDPTR